MFGMFFEILRVEQRRRDFPMATVRPNRYLSKVFMFMLGVGAVVGGGAGLLQVFSMGNALLFAGGLLLLGNAIRGLRT